MSEFIDEGIFFESKNGKGILNQTSLKSNMQEKNYRNKRDDCFKTIFKIVSYLSSDFLVRYSPKNSQIIEVQLTSSHQTLKSFSLLINFNLDISKNTIGTSLFLIEAEKTYKIQTLDKRILVCKFFSKSYTKNFNKFGISLFQGNFKIIRPILHFSDNQFTELFLSKSQQNNLANLFKTHIKDAITVFKPLLKHLIPSYQNQSPQTHEQGLGPEHYQKLIYRYIMKSSIEPSFDISFGSGKYETMQCLTKDEIYFTNSMIQNIVTDFNQFSSHQLYLRPHSSSSQLKKLYKKQYFSSNDEQLSNLKSKIQPPATRSNMGMNSKYIYNIIEINESFPINLRKINTGGFSQISIAQVQFWYLLTISQKKMAKIQQAKQNNQQIAPQTKIRKQNKKVIVFKSNNYKGIQAGRNRVNHQMKIVSKFKGNPSIFIPQYYKIVNQKSPFLQYVLMEHLPYMNLNEYAQVHKYSLSFMTKIHLSLLIVSALQILRNSGIVHLDLKPSNIIVAKRLIIKLIDFGQSYNKQICQKNFKPAFSNPYGSPEIFDGMGKTQFCEKNDIYSWGVLFFQMLFKRLPFFFPLQKTTKILREKSYMKHIFYVPEEEEKYGCWEIIPLLRDVIMRSLDPNIKIRPYTIWLSVVLKECMSYIINLEHNAMNE